MKLIHLQPAFSSLTQETTVNVKKTFTINTNRKVNFNENNELTFFIEPHF